MTLEEEALAIWPGTNDSHCHQYRINYDLTMPEIRAMYVRQKGICPICGRKMKHPRIDHDHVSGVVRKLLCQRCNSGLGMFEDSIRLLASAIVYLQDHPTDGRVLKTC